MSMNKSEFDGIKRSNLNILLYINMLCGNTNMSVWSKPS